MDVLTDTEKAKLISDLGGDASFASVKWAFERIQNVLDKANEEAKESHRIEKDGIINEMEQNFVKIRSENQMQKKEIERLRIEKKEAVDVLKTKTTGDSEMLEKLRSMENDVLTAKARTERIEAEKNEALLLTAQRKMTIENLRSDLEASEKRLAQLSESSRSFSKDAREAQSKYQALHFDVEKLQKENQLMKKHSTWLDTELEKKTSELLQIRKNASDEAISLRSELDASVSRAKSLAEKLEAAEKRLIDTDGRIDGLLKNVQETRNDAAEDVESWKREVESQRSMSNMYKRNWEEQVEKYEAQSKKYEDARNIVLRQKRKYVAAEAAHKEQIEDLRQARDELERQLRDANEKVESLSSSKASAAASADEEDEKRRRMTATTIGSVASRLMDSPLAREGNIRVTEWYDRVVKAEASLEQEKRERVRVEKYLTQILKEIEQKAPIIAAQRRDYERALRSHTELSVRLEAALADAGRLRGDVDKSKESEEKAIAESKGLRKSVQDLGRQVRMLLWRRHSKDSLSAPSSSKKDDPADADAVISEHLVTFSTVEQMQERNQQLLRVVRRLSEKHDAFVQNQAMSEANVQKVLASKFSKELEEMRAARQRQEAMVVAVVRQRDMYKELLTKEKRDGGKDSVVETVSASPPRSSKRARGEGTKTATTADAAATTPVATAETRMMTQAETQKMMAKEAEVATLRDQLNRGREEFDACRKDQERVLSKMRESLDVERSAASKLRVDLAKSSTQCEFYKQRYENLVAAADAAREDAKRERDERVEMAGKLVRFQQLVSDHERKVEAEHVECEKLRAKILHLDSQRSLWEVTEGRLRDQLKSTREEFSKQAELRETVLQIQRGFESKNSVELERLRESAEIAKLQLSKTRKALEEQQMVALHAQREIQARAAQDAAKLESSRRRTSDLLAQLNESKTDFATQAERFKAVEARALAAERRFEGHLDRLTQKDPSGDNSSAIERLRRVLEEELSDARKTELERIREIEAKLTENEAHLEQYRTIASAAEEALAKFQGTADAREAEFASRISAMKKTIDEHAEAMRLKEEALGANASELARVQKAAADAEEKASSEANAFRREMVEANGRVEQAEKLAESYKEDAAQHAKAREQAESNYQRELQLHAEDMKAVTVAKDALLVSERRSVELSSQIDSLKAEKIEAHVSWNSQKLILEKQIEDVKTREVELKHQTELLHAQLETMTTDVKRAQERQRESAATSAAAALADTKTVGGDGDGEQVRKLRDSLAGLHDVVKFLRQEKKIADCRADIAEQELTRTTKKLEALTKSLDEARIAETIALQKVASQVANTSEHQKLKEQVMQLSLLRESNAELRNKERLVASRALGAEKRIVDIEASIEPLRLREKALIGEIAAAKAEVGSLKRDRDRWQESAQSLIANRNTVDPKEHELLKNMLDERSREHELSKQALDERSREHELLKRALKERSQEHEVMRKSFEEKSNECKALRVKVQSSKSKEQRLRDIALKYKKQAAAGNQGSASKLKEASVLLERTQTTLEDKCKELEEMSKEYATFKDKIESNKSREKRLRDIANKYKSTALKLQKRIDEMCADASAKHQRVKIEPSAATDDLEEEEEKKSSEMADEEEIVSSAVEEAAIVAEHVETAAAATAVAAVAQEQQRLIAERAKKTAELKRQKEENEIAEQERIVALDEERKRERQRQKAEETKRILLEKKAEETKRVLLEKKAEETKRVLLEKRKRLLMVKKRKIEEQRRAAQAKLGADASVLAVAPETATKESHPDNSRTPLEGEEELHLATASDSTISSAVPGPAIPGEASPSLKPMFGRLKAAPASGIVVTTGATDPAKNSKIQSLKDRIMRKRKLSAERASLSPSQSSNSPPHKWQFALKSGWRDFKPADSQRVEAAYNLGAKNPLELCQITISNKSVTYTVTIFPKVDRGQRRDDRPQLPLRSIRRVAVESKTLSAFAKEFVPSARKKRERETTPAAADTSPPPASKSKTDLSSDVSAAVPSPFDSSDTVEVETVSPSRELTIPSPTAHFTNSEGFNWPAAAATGGDGETANVFESTPAAPTTTGDNLYTGGDISSTFGSTTTKIKDTDDAPAAFNSMVGDSEPATSTSFFGTPVEGADATSSNMFGSNSVIFGSATGGAGSTTNMFGFGSTTTETGNAANIFGSTTPGGADPTASIFGATTSGGADATANIFGSTTTPGGADEKTNPFGDPAFGGGDLVGGPFGESSNSSSPPLRKISSDVSEDERRKMRAARFASSAPSRSAKKRGRQDATEESATTKPGAEGSPKAAKVPRIPLTQAETDKAIDDEDDGPYGAILDEGDAHGGYEKESE
eukprot:g1677.t1